MSERSFLAELKRRNVIRVAIAYVAVGWLAMQVCALGVEVMELPKAISKGLLVLLAVGFIPTLVFSWIYEITPEGLKKESEIERDESITHLTGRRLDYLVIGVLGAVVALLLVDKFVVSPRHAARVAASAANTAPAEAVPAPAARAPSQTSIAVLPFVNMSSDKEQEYFSDGISEELLNLLAKIPQLQVAARTSSFSFKGKDVPIPEIAKTLFVANVLEGSIRKSGNQVRITAQLVRASDGYHLWSETYDRKLDDIFKIQDEIAAKVVAQLRVTLLGSAPRSHTTNPEAYALYLQAGQLAALNTADGYAQSDVLLRKALAIDARYAPAWTALARNIHNEANFGQLSYQAAYAQAREAAEQALAIDADYAPAHARIGVIAMDENDLGNAAAHLARALALAPTNLDVLRLGGLLLANLGRMDEALAVDEAIVRRDPFNAAALARLGFKRRTAGRLDPAIAAFRAVLSMSPGRGNAHAQLGLVLVQKGDAEAGLAEIQREPSDLWKQVALPIAYHALGRKADSDAALAALIAKYEKGAPFNIAYVHAFRGDADQAFEWLAKAVAYGDSGVSDMVAENLLDNIRSDPRWLPFLRKLGKAPEQLAQIEFKVTLPAEWQAEARE